jgi:hypothetical protein
MAAASVTASNKGMYLSGWTLSQGWGAAKVNELKLLP